MAKLGPPAVGEKVVPVFTDEELTKLLEHCEGKTFTQRRDFAILALFKATGLRLSELAGIIYDADDPERGDLDLMRRGLLVTGKGNKQRIVRFGHPSARAIDRYIRVRNKHTYASSRQLWLGTNNRPPMTANGIYQMVVRRGEECGVTVHPHKFRHHFSHTWLDKAAPKATSWNSTAGHHPRCSAATAAAPPAPEPAAPTTASWRTSQPQRSPGASRRGFAHASALLPYLRRPLGQPQHVGPLGQLSPLPPFLNRESALRVDLALEPGQERVPSLASCAASDPGSCSMTQAQRSACRSPPRSPCSRSVMPRSCPSCRDTLFHLSAPSRVRPSSRS